MDKTESDRMKPLITKAQGEACLREAEHYLRHRYIRVDEVRDALRALGWGRDKLSLFDLDKNFYFDGRQVVVALCFAAAVAGVKP
jgi:hypothetical protein